MPMSWVARVARRRLSASWRLLAVVVAVAVLAATTVCTLGLLVSATEQGGTRAALAALPASESRLVVDEREVRGSLAVNQKAATAAVTRALGSSVPVTVATQAFTRPDAAYVGAAVPDASYFGEIPGIRSEAVLVSGSWPTLGATSAAAAISVAIPQAGAAAAHLQVGTQFEVQIGAHVRRTVAVVGIYRATHPASSFWDRDPLQGAGYKPSYPLPGGTAPDTDGFGPMVVAPGALVATATPVESARFVFSPDFRTLSVASIAPLIHRLSAASDDVPARLSDGAGRIEFDSNLSPSLAAVSGGLIVTRSTVVIVGLLLLLLAIGALAQTARLFNEAQSTERALMAARGASRAQMLLLTIVQSVIVGVLIAGLAPLLAWTAYAGLAAVPAMIRAGVPRESGLPAGVWLSAAIVALLFVVVLIAPQLGRADTFIEAEQGKGRQRRGIGLLRSGLDLGVTLLAAVLYWQLLTYRGPVRHGAAPAIDPVLVAAPAVVLMACALVSLRLIPAAAHLADRIASRRHGAVLALAAWEVARRSRQSVSAVLLLTLALGVGTFGLSFLATWQQSQVDQANLAVGPPLRVPASPGATARQGVALAKGAVSSPQPVIDRPVLLANSVQDAVILGLGKHARAGLDHGRLADEGGARINALADGAARQASGFALPADATGITARVQIGEAGATVHGVTADLTVILESRDGLLSTAQMGSVLIDGLPHETHGRLPANVRGASGLRIVGLEIGIVSDGSPSRQDNPATPVDVLVGDLRAISPSDSGTGSGVPLHIGTTNRWSAMPIGAAPGPATTGAAPGGWQLRMGIVVPARAGTTTAEFALTGWTPNPKVVGLITSSLAKATDAHVGDALLFDISGAQISVTVAGIVPVVPATTPLAQLTSAGMTAAAHGANPAVVVDHTALQRALIEAGVDGPFIDEWWVDVPPGHAAAYLASHSTSTAGARSAELLASELEAGPLRIATQASLWLAVIAGAVLASIGFAVHTAAAMRARRLEFAQLRAIGLSRRALAGVIGAESALLGVIGAAFGVGIGVLLSWLVGPLVAVSPDGSAAVPAVVPEFPGAQVAVLVLVVLAALACVVVIVAQGQRSVRPAEILRGGDE